MFRLNNDLSLLSWIDSIDHYHELVKIELQLEVFEKFLQYKSPFTTASKVFPRYNAARNFLPPPFEWFLKTCTTGCDGNENMDCLKSNCVKEIHYDLSKFSKISAIPPFFWKVKRNFYKYMMKWLVTKFPTITGWGKLPYS